MKTLILALNLTTVLYSTLLSLTSPPNVLIHNAWVNDYAHILTPHDKTELEVNLNNFNNKTGKGIYIITLDELPEGRYSKEFASSLLESERLNDNEALALYVKDTNSISIRTMPNMHKFISDSNAKHIINKVKALMDTDLSSSILLLGTDLIREFYTTIYIWVLLIFLFILGGLYVLSLDEPLDNDKSDRETYYYIDDSHSNESDGGADG